VLAADLRSRPMAGALDGLRVIELGGEIAAPYATKLLTDDEIDSLERDGVIGQEMRSG
jgi:hypothetical protein